MSGSGRGSGSWGACCLKLRWRASSPTASSGSKPPFSGEIAGAGCAWLWEATGLSPDAPETWTEAKIWIHGSDAECFLAAGASPRLTSAFDDLVGAGRWRPYQGLGTFPIRFPHRPETEPDDKDWHIENSWQPGEATSARTNVFSRARLLLVLFLFSDVDADNGATRIKVGSHLEMARRLEPFGAEGVVWPAQVELARDAPGEVVLATGRAGDVYLCHPFLVHAAAANVGTRVRFIAQPALAPIEEVCLERSDAREYSPVERAIRLGLGRDAP